MDIMPITIQEVVFKIVPVLIRHTKIQARCLVLLNVLLDILVTTRLILIKSASHRVLVGGSLTIRPGPALKRVPPTPHSTLIRLVELV